MMRSSVTAAQDLSCVKPKPFKIGLKAFSMIEVMVVSGLLSIIGLAITSVVSNSTKAQKRLEQKEQQQGNAGYIRSILQDPTLCRNAFCPEDGGFASAAATPCGEKQYNKLPPDANWNIAANNPRKIRSIQLYSGGAALQQTVLTCLTTDGCNNHVYNAITNFPPVAPPYGTPVPGSPGLYVYGMMVTEIIDRGVIGSERVSTANLVVQYAQDPKLISGGKFPDTRIALILRATTGGTGRIESCTSGAVDSLWTLHANGLDVFRAGGRVGIGATRPISPLSISGPEGSINIDRFAGGPHLILRQANGTQLAPTATATGDITGRVSGWSYENVGATYSSTGLIDFLAAENQTAAARGGHIAFSTTDTGGVAVTEKMRIAAGGNV